MLLVDSIVEINAEAVTALFKVPADCIFLDGKYLCESGLIESAAQACSAIVGQNYFEADDLNGAGNKVIGYISAIRRIYIHLLPQVGDTLITKAKLVSRYEGDGTSMCTIQGRTFRNDDLIVDCSLNFLIHEVR